MVAGALWLAVFVGFGLTGRKSSGHPSLGITSKRKPGAAEAASAEKLAQPPQKPSPDFDPFFPYSEATKGTRPKPTRPKPTRVPAGGVERRSEKRVTVTALNYFDLPMEDDSPTLPLTTLQLSESPPREIGDGDDASLPMQWDESAQQSEESHASAPIISAPSEAVEAKVVESAPPSNEKANAPGPMRDKSESEMGTEPFKATTGDDSRNLFGNLRRGLKKTSAGLIFWRREEEQRASQPPPSRPSTRGSSRQRAASGPRFVAPYNYIQASSYEAPKPTQPSFVRSASATGGSMTSAPRWQAPASPSYQAAGSPSYQAPASSSYAAPDGEPETRLETHEEQFSPFIQDVDWPERRDEDESVSAPPATHRRLAQALDVEQPRDSLSPEAVGAEPAPLPPTRRVIEPAARLEGVFGPRQDTNLDEAAFEQGVEGVRVLMAEAVRKVQPKPEPRSREELGKRGPVTETEPAPTEAFHEPEPVIAEQTDDEIEGKIEESETDRNAAPQKRVGVVTAGGLTYFLVDEEGRVLVD